MEFSIFGLLIICTFIYKEGKEAGGGRERKRGREEMCMCVQFPKG